MIEFQDVHIAYGDAEVIKGLSFEVKQGEIFGIIGPNGAGKTTILRALAGIIVPDKGRIIINGKDVKELKAEERKIAMLFETAAGGSFLRLTPEEDLEFYAALYNVSVSEERIRETLKIVGLYEERKKHLYKFSRGMWQKLYLARVILPDYPVIVLDEPWLGLDVVSQQETVETLKKFREMGKTIVLTAHEMPLIERACTRIMLIKGGKKIIEGEPSKLFEAMDWEYKIVIKGQKKENTIYVKDLKEAVSAIKENELYEAEIEHVSLEDIYLKLLG